MADHDRALAWLDAHPEIVEAAARAHEDWDLGQPGRPAEFPAWSELGDIERAPIRADMRASLVAFLTTPFPCATCGGKRVVPRGWEKVVNAHDLQLCPDCTDGTAGILLDQLERGAA